ncbi:MAG: tetratricopeptide repeat protein, partial [Bacteroidia bacterium]|nr:tetratricopeptide repeat protein [Bacteroidia bacterium]
KPDYADAYINRGIGYRKSGDYNKAIQDYSKAIEIKPDFAEAYNSRAIAYNKSGDYNKAIQDYKKAIDLDPKDAGNYLNFSEFNIVTGNYNASLELIEKAFSFCEETDKKAICLFLQYITKKMLDIDTSACEKEFKEILNKGFSTTWDFDEIEAWLKNQKIITEKKDLLIKLTEDIKRHQSKR